MPNALAYAMLLIWPFVAWAMFRKMPLERAFVWTILGGYLILPPATAIDLPLLPALDKHTIPNLSAVLFALFVARHKMAMLPRAWLARVLVALFVLGAIPTVLTNGHVIPFQSIANSAPIDTTTGALPGLGLRDLISITIAQVFVLLPFLLAREVLASPEGRRELMLGLVVGGVAYTLPSLLEIRLSPQLNIWIYGFFQHDFQQMMRDGGFRPIVFLPHALWLAFFLVTAALAAAGLYTAEAAPERRRFLLAAGWLMAVILLCKSMAAIVYMLALVPVILVTSERARLRLALLFVLLALVYPALRNAELLPLDRAVSAAHEISPERAESLAYRFDNEEILLGHAHRQPWFGWGGWGRNLVHDSATGQTETITDGRWIIVVGMSGLVGFVAEFGLLASPVLLLWWRSRRAPPERLGCGTLAVILGLTMIDMLINAPLVPYVWMIAGALLGQAEALAVPRKAARARQGPRALLGDTRPSGGRRTML